MKSITLEWVAKAEGDWSPLAYFGVLIVGGIALFVPGPWLASRVLHHDFSTSFLIFTSLVNIHHFILDGAIWKLRDGRIAALLLNSKERVASAMADAGGRFRTAWGWVTGASAGVGRATAKAFARRGFDVAVLARKALAGGLSRLTSSVLR